MPRGMLDPELIADEFQGLAAVELAKIVDGEHIRGVEKQLRFR